MTNDNTPKPLPTLDLLTFKMVSECIAFLFTVSKYGVPTGSPIIRLQKIEGLGNLVLVDTPIQTTDGVTTITYVPGKITPGAIVDYDDLRRYWDTVASWWNTCSAERRHETWRASEAYRANLLQICHKLVVSKAVSTGTSTRDDDDIYVPYLDSKSDDKTEKTEVEEAIEEALALSNEPREEDYEDAEGAEIVGEEEEEKETGEPEAVEEIRWN